MDSTWSGVRAKVIIRSRAYSRVPGPCTASILIFPPKFDSAFPRALLRTLDIASLREVRVDADCFALRASAFRVSVRGFAIRCRPSGASQRSTVRLETPKSRAAAAVLISLRFPGP